MLRQTLGLGSVVLAACVAAQAQSDPRFIVGNLATQSAQTAAFGSYDPTAQYDLFLKGPLDLNHHRTLQNAAGLPGSIDAPFVAAMKIPDALIPAVGEEARMAFWVGSLTGPAGIYACAGWTLHNKFVDRLLIFASFTDQASAFAMLQRMGSSEIDITSGCAVTDAAYSVCMQHAKEGSDACQSKLADKLWLEGIPSEIGAWISCVACLALPNPFTCLMCGAFVYGIGDGVFNTMRQLLDLNAEVNRAESCCCTNAQARHDGVQPTPSDSDCKVTCP